MSEPLGSADPRARGAGPPGCGIGLKPDHWPALIRGDARAAWVEIHAENFFDAGGLPHRALTAIRGHHALSVHGVGLSLGSAQGLDPDHLEALARVVARYEPALVSEHLAWNAVDGFRLPDLLPLPYDAESLAIVAANVAATQDRLKRSILVETPARYADLNQDPLAEAHFLTDLIARAGCGLLLDANNIHVSSVNLGFDALDYVRALPLDAVGEIHLAGHGADPLVPGLLIDTHGARVADPVWALYAEVLALTGPKPSLIEWDTDVPALAVLLDEARRAEDLMAAARPGLSEARHVRAS